MSTCYFGYEKTDYKFKYKKCLYCDRMLALCYKTRSRKVCDSPVCQQRKKDERIKKSVATRNKRKEIKRAMTEETPYLSTKEWLQRRLRQRVEMARRGEL